MVPLFRELADTSLGDMMELQKNQLADIVGGRITYFGKALQSDESLHEWSEAETALAAGIYHLRHLSQAWKPILSPSVFVRALGYLADVLFTMYLQQVTSATDISPSACQFTGALFHKATVDIAGLLGPALDPSQFATEWGRFEAVGKFLELNQLSQVEQALSSGVFRHVASQELGRLIQATFGDSPHRRALLQSLTSAV
jgi:centromere/kinetochore protein ZW10